VVQNIAPSRIMRRMSHGTPLERVQPLWFINHLVEIHVDVDASDGTLALIDERGRHGDMPPLHVHHRDDETFYVIEGGLSLFVGEEQVTVGAGQAAFAPREVPHTSVLSFSEARPRCPIPSPCQGRDGPAVRRRRAG
jgi:mannose-6-phosphate isomerase-like protein (cupin superfamily)